MNGSELAGLMRAVDRSINLDMALVIDCTGGMAEFLSMLKHRINTLHEEVTAQLREKRYRVNRLRVKVIAFRDFYYDDAASQHPPLQISPFFELPAQNEALTEFVRSLDACGGGDEPESALEALHYAFCSEWDMQRDARKNRQIIVLFTDAPAHSLDDSRRCDAYYHHGAYPEEQMPLWLGELYEEYRCEDRRPARERRLLLIAPKDAYPWREISEEWEMTMLSSVNMDEALSDRNIRALYEMLI